MYIHKSLQLKILLYIYKKEIHHNFKNSKVYYNKRIYNTFIIF